MLSVDNSLEFEESELKRENVFMLIGISSSLPNTFV